MTHTTPFKVWHSQPEGIGFREFPAMHIVAQFTYFQEALDYGDYCQSRKAPYVITGPSGYISDHQA